jgi:hypothetical protein
MPKIFWKLVAVTVLGFVLQTAGRFSNETVVGANQDQMPVWCVSHKVCADLLMDPEHTFLTKESKLKVLSDIFPVWEPMNGGIEVEAMASIGDAGLFIGWLLFELGLIGIAAYIIFAPAYGLWKYIRTKRKIVV